MTRDTERKANLTGCGNMVAGVEGERGGEQENGEECRRVRAATCARGTFPQLVLFPERVASDGQNLIRQHLKGGDSHRG